MEEQIAKIFKALADTSRLKIFHSLMIISSALSISQISEEFNMSRQAVTKHIKILEEAQLIVISKMGREKKCLANPKTLSACKKWLAFYDKFWDSSLAQLADYLEKEK